jgi:hypothetical protein
MINTSIVKDKTTSEGDKTLSASDKSDTITAVLLQKRAVVMNHITLFQAGVLC